MKIVNIILSVLILLLAVASAVFSYFLFEKREQMVKGWEKMAVTVNQTAAELDKGSGTNVAKSLAPDVLSHEKYAELDKNLTQLTQQAQKIVQQRDDMGSTIKKIASVTEMKSIPEDSDFLKLDAYLASKNKVVGWIEESKERQDGTIKQLCEAGSKLGVSLSADAMKTAEYSGEMRKFSDRVGAVQTRISSYNDSFSQIASTLGASSPDFGDSAYSSSIKSITDAATKMKDDLSSTKSSLDSANNQLASLQNTVKDKDGNIQNLQRKIVKNEEVINKLKIIIDPKGANKSADDFKLWTDGSTEARMAVQGKIIDINRKYGFLVVDLGTNTKVEQAVGSKTNAVNPKIANNIDMIVARGLEGDNTQYVGRIKIIKVHDNCSIANVIPGSTGDREIKIGDTVYFSSDAISAMNK
jgi:predicted  nucleic acid-binding Zn-ribbon protein